MSDESKFWLCCWSIVAGTLCFVTAACITDDMYGSAKVAEIIAQGKSPVAAHCAVYGSSQSTQFDCNLLITKGE